ncbi:MAG: hypothetical protein IT201_02830 [Thermoleophilia bacterium]|nr:hypothetical protein [Thermoleophilia bacterium]
MNASELLAALGGIPGARRLPGDASAVAESALVAGVWIARASSADERGLRRAWRDRSRGSPDPLLVVADDPEDEGAVRALGPLRADGPLRLVELWKGESFDQFDPHGSEARLCPGNDEVRRRGRSKRPGKDSILARTSPLPTLVSATDEERTRARVAFRDVTNRTNSRTVVAALIPPKTFLVNSAPYLVP